MKSLSIKVYHLKNQIKDNLQEIRRVENTIKKTGTPPSQDIEKELNALREIKDVLIQRNTHFKDLIEIINNYDSLVSSLL